MLLLVEYVALLGHQLLPEMLRIVSQYMYKVLSDYVDKHCMVPSISNSMVLSAIIWD